MPSETTFGPWQPMSSAPRDGTSILAVLRFKDDDTLSGVVAVHFMADRNKGEWVSSFCYIGFENTGDESDDCYCDVWMPLPKPPATRLLHAVLAGGGHE